MIYNGNMGKMRDIKVMGIVNLTDDSYFAASRCLGGNISDTIDRVLMRVDEMVAQGASIIDIGSCSTRPGGEIIPEDLEWKRMATVLAPLRSTFPDLSVSIDTFRSYVVERAYDVLGNFIVNDITAGEADADMLPLVGSLGLGYVAMHSRGTPQTMQSMCDYDDVVMQVQSYFDEFAVRAMSFGVHEWILDPGFGFAKTIDQNYELLKNLKQFTLEGHEVLVGVSRKSMIYKYLGLTQDDVLSATQVLHMKALQEGASILRVHDVKEAIQTVNLYTKLL